MSDNNLPKEQPPESTRLDILATLAIAVLYMAYTLSAIWAPDWLASPVFAGGPISLGLVLGLLLVVVIVISALAYDGLRRRQEKAAALKSDLEGGAK